MPGMPNLRPGLGRKAGAGPIPPAPQSWGSGAGVQSWWPLLPPVPLSRDFNLVTVTAPVVDSVPQRRRERGLVCRLPIRAMQTRAPRGGSETGERRRQRGRGWGTSRQLLSVAGGRPGARMSSQARDAGAGRRALRVLTSKRKRTPGASESVCNQPGSSFLWFQMPHRCPPPPSTLVSKALLTTQAWGGQQSFVNCL